MLKLFLVEDETIIRETLRDTVPWNQCGFSYVGEASDGEMALAKIRQTMPDVLVTDIRMPFMDGLTLSKLVLSEFPEMKIIILSGYDDFEYAQHAIALGVERYLLKPITKSGLVSVLQDVREKIESQREARNYSTQFHKDIQEYEQYARRAFVEKIVSGVLLKQEIFAQASQLGIDLSAEQYCLAMFCVTPDMGGGMETYSDTAAQVRDTLLQHFLKHPEDLLFRWNMSSYLVILKGERENMAGYIQRCISAVGTQYENVDPNLKWYLAMSPVFDRIEEMQARFEELSKLWACRYLFPEQHLLTADTVGSYLRSTGSQSIQQLDVRKCNPAILQDVMKNASQTELASFVDTFLDSVRDGLSSAPFCHYLMLNVRFTATDYVMNVLSEPQERLLESITTVDLVGKPVTEDDLHTYLMEYLSRAVTLRDRVSNRQYCRQLQQAIGYIDEHFPEESLSLNRVAQEVNISPNYLSAVFSQETGNTFVEYVTQKRMTKAKQLLRSTDMRSGDVAQAVGYRDPHYFSFLFRKTQGCTPRDYRSGGKQNES